ncbi:hypothetical protein BDV19DRAFT_252641 [Aspergillus venezuelensis]
MDHYPHHSLPPAPVVECLFDTFLYKIHTRAYTCLPETEADGSSIRTLQGDKELKAHTRAAKWQHPTFEADLDGCITLIPSCKTTAQSHHVGRSRRRIGTSQPCSSSALLCSRSGVLGQPERGVYPVPACRVAMDFIFALLLSWPLSFNLVSSAQHHHGSPTPPTPILHSVIDTFFLRLYSRFYTCILEDQFRKELETGTLPEHLLLAVLGAAIPLSTEAYYQHTRLEAARSYLSASWASLLKEHLPATENGSIRNPRAEIAQTCNLLGVLDWSTGRPSSVRLKFRLAARVYSKLKLNIEPPSCLPFTQQEERRRIFWTTYVLNTLYSSPKSPIFPDNQCLLQLPCDEDTFRVGEWQNMLTLRDAIACNFEVDEPPNASCLVVLLTSIYGHCSRYARWGEPDDRIPPWDVSSEFSQITNLLHRIGINYRSSSRTFLKELRSVSISRQMEQAHVLFSRILSHMCHCLLYHPFVMQQRLKSFEPSVDFRLKLLAEADTHAQQFIDIMGEASQLEGYRTRAACIWPN